MKFILVRHGETDWNRLGKFQGQDDISLNQRGIAQSRETAQAVAGLQPTALYSSPLSRTMQVAEEISRLAGLPVISHDGFKELKLGAAEGVTGEEMRYRWPQVYDAWRNDPATAVMPGGESLAQLQNRTWQAILSLERPHNEDETLVVVSHNFAIRTVIAKLLEMSLFYFHRMTLGLGSICTFESTPQGRRLISYNSICHLSLQNRQ